MLLMLACEDSYHPKPFGYFRFDLPEHNYQAYSSQCGFSFEHPVYARVFDGQEACWKNLYIKPIDGTIHLTYEQISGNFDLFLENSQELVYQHTSKADGIKQSTYINEEKKVFGMLYELMGNTASAIQFYATDSTDHFLRGALYFNSAPNQDSLAPLIEFATQDIRYLMSTIQWTTSE